MLSRILRWCVAGVGLAFGAGLLLVLIFAVLIVAPSHPVLPKGWTLQKECSGANCWDAGATPDSGRWLRFRIGMSHREALNALCDAVLNKQVHDAPSVVEIRGDRCIIDRATPGRDIWGLTAPGFWCAPSFQKQTIYFDFDKKDLHLTRIAAYCPVLDL